MTFSRFDHECMALALALAAKGINSTRPNPRVGCVLARDGRVLASGWHVSAGTAHAEVVALESAGEDAQGATAYVTLEPCSHQGRTPPCTDALLAAGVSRVVCAMEDPNIRVSGAGRRKLQEAGVQVDCGLMAAAAEELNAGFLMRMRSGRPWVRVKLACSLDGRTALANGVSQWISSEASRADVQQWRARSCAIITGIGTVLADDPALTARIGEPALQPLRVVVDTKWRTPVRSRVVLGPAAALIAGSQERPIPAALAASSAECLRLPEVDGRIDVHALLRALAMRELNEVQVEAGANLCGALLKAAVVDEIVLYQAPVLLGEGGPGLFNIGVLESMANRVQLNVEETCYFGVDMRLRLRPFPGSLTPDWQLGDMFTGIVSAVGVVREIHPVGGDFQIRIATDIVQSGTVREGDSISVSGVCLTMLQPGGEGFAADVSAETLGVTTLGSIKTGNRLNLELAMSLSDRLGGHLVTGHVDGIARLVKRQPDGRAQRFDFELPEGLSKYVARKGSVCIDGVSLTVNSVAGEIFSVCLIPHTLDATTLGSLELGDSVNIEVDLIARYLEQLGAQG